MWLRRLTLDCVVTGERGVDGRTCNGKMETQPRFAGWLDDGGAVMVNQLRSFLWLVAEVEDECWQQGQTVSSRK